jgi:hypothetical protein
MERPKIDPQSLPQAILFMLRCWLFVEKSRGGWLSQPLLSL